MRTRKVLAVLLAVLVFMSSFACVESLAADAVKSSIGAASALDFSGFNTALQTGVKNVGTGLNSLLSATFNGVRFIANALTERITLTQPSPSQTDSTVYYEVGNTYTVRLPMRIRATKPTEEKFKYDIVAEDVMLPVKTELGIYLLDTGTMVNARDESVELKYTVYKDVDGKTDVAMKTPRDRVLKAPAGFPEGKSGDIYATLNEHALYAGLYTEDTVTFEISVTDSSFTEEDIQANPLLVEIGKTSPSYVIAQFSDDYTAVTIFANGAGSDGLMKDWNDADATNPFYQHRDTLQSVAFSGEYTLVKSIGNRAFKDCTNLTGTVTLPGYLESIGTQAFNGCTGITSLVIGSTETSVDDPQIPASGGGLHVTLNASPLRALANVIGANGETVAYPTKQRVNANASMVVGASAFGGCSGMTSVSIGNTVKEIKEKAFVDCSGLTEFNAGASTSIVGSAILRNCTNLKKVVFQNVAGFGDALSGAPEKLNVFILSENFINNNNQLTVGTKVFIGKDVKKFGVQRDIDTYNFTPSPLFVPGEVYENGSYVGNSNVVIHFEDGSRLESVGGNLIQGRIQNPYYGFYNYSDNFYFENLDLTNVKRIYSGAFDGCEHLTSLKTSSWRPTQLEFIGANAFRATNLTLDTIEFPASTQYIGASAFANVCDKAIHNNYVNWSETVSCAPNIKHVVFADGCAATIGTGAFAVTHSAAITLDLSDHLELGYAGGRLDFYFLGHNNWYGDGTARDCPDTVTKAEWEAMQEGVVDDGLASIKDVDFGNAIVTIGANAFSGQTKLKRINIPNSCTTLGSEAFSGCTGVEEIVLGNGVTSLGEGAFAGMTSLEKLVFPAGMTTIPKNCCRYCYNLDDVTLPTNVVEFGDYCFAECPITTTGIGSETETIGKGAFWGCENITEDLIFTDSVAHIGMYAFCGVPSQKVVLGENVETVDVGAFCDVPVTEIQILGTDTKLNVAQERNRVVTPNNTFRYGGVFNSPAVTKVVIGKTVLDSCDWYSLGARFYTNLWDLVLLDTVESIGGMGGYDGSTPEMTVIEHTSFGDYERTLYCGGNSPNATPMLRSVTSEGFTPKDGEIQLADTITGITDYAFSNAVNITKTNLPADITSIGKYAYSNTHINQDLVIPDGVTLIDNNAFASCTSIRSLTLPNGIETIGDSAFSGCTGMAGTLALPESLENIGSSAFYRCISLTGDLVVPSQITEIKNSTFYQCSGMNGNLTLPEGITSIGENAFRECGLRGTLTVPGTVETIGRWAFYLCRGFSHLAPLPTGLTTIGKSAFASCSGVHETSFTVPASVTDVGQYAFYEIGSLGDLTIGNALLSDYEFQNTNLTSITWNDNITAIPSYCFADTNLTGHALTLPANCTTINSYAFARNKFASIAFNDVLEEIGGAAFLDCGPNTTIHMANFPASLKTIGDSAFKNALVDNVTLNNGLATIGSYAFACTTRNLVYNEGEALVIPNSVTSVGQYAFAGNYYREDIRDDNGYYVKTVVRKPSPAYTSIVIGSGLQTINEGTFSNNRRLTGALSIPGTVEIIGEYAFALLRSPSINLTQTLEDVNQSDDHVTSVTFGEGIIDIGANAFFYRLTNVTSLEFPDSLTTIGNRAFSPVSHVTSITFGENLATIGAKAFYAVQALDGTLVIPDKVTTIGESAFYYCGELDKLICGTSLNTVGDYAFYNFGGELVMLGTIENVGTYAFGAPHEDDYGAVYLGNSLLSFTNKLNVDTYTVRPGTVNINQSAFRNVMGLTTVNLPTSVTIIGDNAFDNCVDLTTVNGATNVVSIGQSCFRNTKLERLGTDDGGVYVDATHFHIPENMERFADESIPKNLIQDQAVFDIDCKNFTHEVGAVFTTAFSASNTERTFVDINRFDFSGVEEIYGIDGDVRFNGDFVVPDSVTVIGDNAFKNNQFTSITAGNNLKYVGDSAFESYYYTPPLTETVVVSLGNGLEHIGANAFTCDVKKYATNSAAIPSVFVDFGTLNLENCEYIGSFAFSSKCTVLSSYSWESPSVYYGYANIEELTIGQNATTLQQNAFYSCKLGKLNYDAPVADASTKSALNVKTSYELVLGPHVQTIESVGFKAKGAVVIPANVTRIAGTNQATQAAFVGSLITSITFEGDQNSDELAIDGLAFYLNQSNPLTSLDFGHRPIVMNPTNEYGQLYNGSIYSAVDTLYVPASVSFAEFQTSEGNGPGNSYTANGLAGLKVTSLTFERVDPAWRTFSTEYMTGLGNRDIIYSALPLQKSELKNLTLEYVPDSFFTEAAYLKSDGSLLEGHKAPGPLTLYGLDSLTVNGPTTLKLEDITKEDGRYSGGGLTTKKLVLGNSFARIKSGTFVDKSFGSDDTQGGDYGLYLPENCVVESGAFVGVGASRVVVPGTCQIEDAGFWNLRARDLVLQNGFDATYAAMHETACTASYNNRGYYETSKNVAFPRAVVTNLNVDCAYYYTSFPFYMVNNVSFGPNATLYENSSLTQFAFRKTLEQQGYDYDNRDITNVQTVTADQANTTMFVQDNILYERGTNRFLIIGSVMPETVTIPEGISVIPSRAFDGSAGVKTFVLPSTLRTINDSAFSNSSLENVNFPAGLTYIGSGAFYSTMLAGDLVLPDGVTSIKDSAFSRTEITSVTFPNSVMSIDSYAFSSCTSLAEIRHWPASLRVIGPSAFAGDTSLTGNLVIGSNISSLGSYAFNGCNFTNILIDRPNIRNIPYNMFYHSTATGIVRIGPATQSISDSAFEGCSNFTELDLSQATSLTNIGYHAFRDWSSLSGTITIPDSVTSIGTEAFFDSTFSNTVTQLTLNRSVTLGEDALAGHPQLATITLTGNGRLEVRDNALVSGDTLLLGTTAVPADYTVPSYIKQVGNYAFAHNPTITSLTIPANVQQVNRSAFMGLPNMTSLTFEEGVRKVLAYSFAYNTALTGDIQLPDSLLVIGAHAFDGCTAIHWIGIGPNTGSVGEDAFKDVTGVTLDPDNQFVKIVNGEFVSEDASAFERRCIGAGDDPSLVMFTVSADGKTIRISGEGPMKNWGYYNNSSTVDSPFAEYMPTVENIIIDDGVTSIGSYAFAYKGQYGYHLLGSNVTNVSIGNDVATIGDGAFAGTPASAFNLNSNTRFHLVDGNLMDAANTVIYAGNRTQTTVNIPNTVTNISAGAFLGSAATTINVPSSVSYFGPATFAEATNLVTLRLDGIRAAGEDLTRNCNALRNIYLPVNMPLTYDYDDIFRDTFSSKPNGVTLYITGSGAGPVCELDANAFADSEPMLPGILSAVYLYPETVVVGDEVTALSGYSMLGMIGGEGSVKRVVLGRNLTTIPASTFTAQPVEQIDLNGNANFVLEDGILYNADKSNLCILTTAATDFVAPSGMTSIPVYFGAMSNLERVTIGAQVTDILPAAFVMLPKLEEITVKGSSTTVGEMFLYRSGSENTTANHVITVYAPETSLIHDYVTQTNNGSDIYANLSFVGFTGPDCVYDADTRTLTISGDIPMQDFAITGDTTTSDYFEYLDEAETIIIGSGVEHIGACAFAFPPADNGETSTVQRIVIGPDVASIGANAFYGLDFSTVDFTGNTHLSALPNGTIMSADGTTLITAAADAQNKVIVPNTVTAISSTAFAGLNPVEIDLPASVTYVPEGAFAGMTNLVTLKMPGLRDGGAGITEGDEALRHVYIPADLPLVNMDTMPDFAGAFMDTFTETHSGVTLHLTGNNTGNVPCTITGADVENDGLQLPIYAMFMQELNPDTIAIEDGVTSITALAFMSMFQEDGPTVTNLVIGSTLQSIAPSAFAGQSYLHTVTLGQNRNFVLENGVLYNSDKTSIAAILDTAETVFVPSAMTTVPLFFGAYSQAKNIVLASGVSALDYGAFSGMANLERLTVKNASLTFGEEALCDCGSSNTTNGVVTIVAAEGSSAQMFATNPPSGIGTTFVFEALMGPTATYDESTKTLTLSGDTPMADCSIVNGQSTSQYAEYLEQAEHIVIADDVVNIGAYAFAYTGNSSTVQDITVGSGVQTIGTGAFQGLDLSIVDFSGNSNFSQSNGMLLSADGATLYQASADANGLVSVPNGVTALAAGAFTGVAATEIDLPTTVTYVGDGAFANMTSLEVLKMPNVMLIGDDVTAGCTNLTDLYIPANIGGAFDVNSGDGNTPFNNTDCDPITLHLTGNGDTVTFDYTIEDMAEEMITANMNEEEFTAFVIPALAYYASRIDIDTVVIEDGVTDLPLGTFLEQHIGTLVLGADVENIAANAFAACTIDNIDLGENTNFVMEEGNLLKADRSAYVTTLSSATKVIIPGGMERVPFYAASNLPNATQLVVEEGVKVLDAMSLVFDGFTDITIPNDLELYQYFKYSMVEMQTPLSGAGSGAPVTLRIIGTGDAPECSFDGEALFAQIGEYMESDPLQIEFAVPFTALIDEINITTVVIDDEVTSIPGYLFCNMLLGGTGSIQTLTLGSGLTDMGDCAFTGQPLTTINLNGNTHFTVEDGILYDSAKTRIYALQSSVTDLTIPDTMTVVPFAFEYGNGYLTSVTIGAGVQKVDVNVLNSCSNLADITVLNPNMQFAMESLLYNCNPTTLHAAAGSTAETYVTDTGDSSLVFAALS